MKITKKHLYKLVREVLESEISSMEGVNENYTITRSQLQHIIKEEAAAIEELRKQGFLKRMAGKVGFGSVKDLTEKAKKLRSEIQAFLEDSPDAWDNPRAAKEHFASHAQQTAIWLDKLATYANATAEEVPNDNQLKFVKSTGKRFTEMLTSAAARADEFTADKIKKEAEEAAYKAMKEREKKEQEAQWAAEAGRKKTWAEMTPEERRAAANRMDRDSEHEMQQGYDQSPGPNENKKITRSQLQQIIKEELAKLNETE